MGIISGLAALGAMVVTLLFTPTDPAEQNTAIPAWVTWAMMITVVVTVAAGVLQWRVIGRNSASVSTIEKSPRDRIVQVRNHLAATARLLSELQDDLATRTRVLEKLQSDAERYERLASLNREQANAIQELIGRQFAGQRKASAWQQVMFLVPAFLLGLIVNWLSAPVLSWISSLV